MECFCKEAIDRQLERRAGAGVAGVEEEGPKMAEWGVEDDRLAATGRLPTGSLVADNL